MKPALLRTLLLNWDTKFLDESSIGLNFKSKYFIIDILKDVNKTIFLISYDMTLSKKIYDRILLLLYFNFFFWSF